MAAAAGGAGVGAMDSAAMTPTASLGSVFSGGADGTTNPDLPIATARYGEEPSSSALMAAQTGETYRTASQTMPPVETLTAATVSLREVAQAPHQSGFVLSLAGGPPGDWPIGGPPGGARNQAFNAHNFAAPPSPRADALIDTRALMVRLGPKDSDRKRGHWFVFAAGSGKAFGLNLIRDPMAGWRPAGWSVERLAEFGKVQLGLGWRKGPAQASVAASRREIGAYGLSREDTVFGISLSLKPGR